MAAGIEARLKELGIVLPALPQPGGNYLPARTVGQIVYLAGVISIHDGHVIAGTAVAGRTIEEGYAAARACALMQSNAGLSLTPRELVRLATLGGAEARHGQSSPLWRGEALFARNASLHHRADRVCPVEHIGGVRFGPPAVPSFRARRRFTEARPRGTRGTPCAGCRKTRSQY